MLRINLLPSYVTQRRRTKRLVPFAVLAVVLSVVLPLLWYASMKVHLADLTQQADTAEQAKNANDALVALAASTKAKVKPIQDKVDFVVAVHKYDRDQVGTISTVANKSPRNSFIYSSMVPGAGYQTMSIAAYSKSVEEVGRYLTAMYHQPVFTSVAVDKIPGYPDTVQHRWYLGKTMVFADGGGSSASGGGGNGYPGSGGGGAATGGAASVEPNSPGNIPSGVGPPPGELTADLPGGGGQGGGYSVNFLRIALAGVSPFASADVQARILRNKLRQVRRVTIPKGFDLNVTATVAPPYAPLSAPAPPGSAPAAGAFGGAFGGGAAPGPGGYPGGGAAPGPGGYPGTYPGGRPGG